MTVRLVGAALPSAPLVEQISRFTPDFEIMNSAPITAPSVTLPMGLLSLRQNQNDGFTVQAQLPSHWQTMNILMSWASITSATGTPKFRADTLQHFEGDLLAGSGSDTFSLGPNYEGSPAATEYKEVASLISENVVVDPTRLIVVRVFRLAAEKDGLAGNIAAFRLRLTRAS